jgi:hypothetical protein
VRRALPWALLGLVGLGTGLGAALGAVGAPGVTPAQWVADVLATTGAAGSARVSFSQVTRSENPVLARSATGTGIVDFARGDVQVTEVDHEIQTDYTAGEPAYQVMGTSVEQVIGIGTTEYWSFPPGPAGPIWVKDPNARDPRQALGLQSADGAGAALAELVSPDPVAAVHDLGSATVDGVLTTRYVVSLRPLHYCGAKPILPLPHYGPSTLWVDAQGRLVQARSSIDVNTVVPASLLRRYPQLAQLPKGSETTTSTLRLSDFGHQVRITAPPATPASSTRIAIKGMLTEHACRS